MARLIDANALLESKWWDSLKDDFDKARAKIIVQSCPTVDAVEVVHGRWLGTHDGWYYSYSCSECGAEALTKEETMHDQVCSNYCHNCGADMRERRTNV